MIKVEHTRTHIVDVPNGTASGKHILHKNVLVTDAELVLVECSMHESLIYKHSNGSWGITKEGIYFYFKEATYYKPTLISKSQKIEVGDWAYDSDGYIFQVTEIKEASGIIRSKDNTFVYDACHKILALPEHFSNEQLQMIVDGKLKDKALVECETRVLRSDLGAIFEGPNGLEYLNDTIIKLNPHITIYPVEEKMVPVSLLEKAWNGGYDSGYNREDSSVDKILFMEWFNKNVK